MQAKEALRGNDGEEDETDYEQLFRYDNWCEVPFKEFDPETASRHRYMTQHPKPTEIWELVYKLAKQKGGFVDPQMVENQWKLIFYPEKEKEETKEKTVQGESGGTAVKEEEEEEKEEEKKGEEEAPVVTESVQVQVQLLKVAGTEDQYVVEFKNKDYGS